MTTLKSALYETSSSNRIQKSVGFWIPGGRFRLHGTGFWILFQWNLDLGFQSFAGFQIPEGKIFGIQITFHGAREAVFCRMNELHNLSF